MISEFIPRPQRLAEGERAFSFGDSRVHQQVTSQMNRHYPLPSQRQDKGPFVAGTSESGNNMPIKLASLVWS